MRNQVDNIIGHVTTGNVLDDLGLDPQTALELKLKYALHLGIMDLIQQHGYSPRDLETILDLQQPRISELLTGKLGTLSVRRLLFYMYKLGGIADVTVRKAA
jgi:predicted XRE-type DNA-binding protein